MSIEKAFHKICQNAVRLNENKWFVTLCYSVQRYGGPEEGGWWTTDFLPVAHQVFPTEELAEKAKEEVLKLAKELSDDARRAHGEHCLRSMEWLDRRGLDADYLPEPDGPEEYSVWVTNEMVKPAYGATHYE